MLGECLIVHVVLVSLNYVRVVYIGALNRYHWIDGNLAGVKVTPFFEISLTDVVIERLFDGNTKICTKERCQSEIQFEAIA